MAISQEKKDSLLKFGLSPGFLSRIEGANKADADGAVLAGVDSKEITPVEDATEEIVKEQEEEVKEDTVDVADGEAEEAVDEKESAPEGDDREMKEFQTVLEKVINVAGKLSERIAALEKVVSTLREDDDARIAEKARSTPIASLTSMADSLEASIIGSPDAKLDGRKALAKAGPEETKSDVKQVTAFPWVNEMIAGEK